MKLKHLTIAAALSLTMGGATAGNFYLGNELFSSLKSERALAAGYIAGVHDVGTGIYVCAPRSATLGQTVDIVEKHLRANPERRHFGADVLIIEALSAVWPCPKDAPAPTGQRASLSLAGGD